MTRGKQPKKRKKRRKKKTDRQRAIEKLDKMFSQYIRLRDSDKKGVCRCITCGTRRHWKKMHAGHFQSRKKMSIRWHEENVHAQCPACNTFREGEQYAYGKELDQRYGEGKADELEQMGRQIRKWSLPELEELIHHYSEEVKALQKTKQLCFIQSKDK